MELELTDEQKMLGDAVKSLLDKRYDANARLQLLENAGSDGAGWSRELWKQYAELGLLGLTVDEQYGGAGMGSGELAVVMEQFGRALVLEPFVATVVLGAALVSELGLPAQKQELLPAVAAGETFLALAHTEPASRWSLDVTTKAAPDGDGWTLDGEKIAVLGGDVADHLLVTAQTPDGLGVFVVAGEDVQRDAYKQQDGLGGADVLLASTPARRLGSEDDAVTALGTVLDTATAMLCAEAVGAMDRMLWLTVDYLKTRQQFGVPISVFQALQFRAADMFVSLEQARSMSMLAQRALAVDDAAERHRMVAAAKVQVDLSSRHVAQDAIQLHGGIGMTMEYPVGHYAKRTAVIAKTLADTDTLLREVGAGEGLVPGVTLDPIAEWTDAQARVIALVAPLTPEQAELTVPATPAWTVRQLLSHMIGLDADVLAGNEPDDHNEAWTQAQVEARAEHDVATLLDEWRAMTDPMQQWMAANNPRPMGDVVIHEQDLRGALAQPGARDTAALESLFGRMAGMCADRMTAKELEPLRLQGEAWSYGPEGADVVVQGPDYELARLVLSRRSAGQLRAMTVHGDVEPYVDCFGGLGPLRDTDLVE